MSHRLSRSAARRRAALVGAVLTAAVGLGVLAATPAEAAPAATAVGAVPAQVSASAPVVTAARATRHHVKHRKHRKHRTRHRVTKTVTSTASNAGITQSGGGEMGWTAPSAPTSTSGTTSSPATADPQASSGTTYGIDVSRYQGNVNWASYYNQGKRFAYVKATEGSTYTSPTFSSQYAGAASAGLIRGAYHFANPSGASGAAQAQFFASHGGGWTADGKTLPGVLDIEYNPYSGGTCYGLSAASMVSWIRSFTTTYKSLTGRDAVIYSTTDWWTRCTGNTSAFAATNPLWIARYNSTVGALPAGWSYYTFWQYSSSPIDQDRFNGSLAGLRKLATG